MANENQVSVLRQGTDAWNSWRDQNPNVYVDLSHADLSELDLKEADLVWVNLDFANLRKTDLTGAHLHGAWLQAGHLLDSNFSDADLYGVNLLGAFMPGARFCGANVSAANFTNAFVHGTDFSRADVYETIFGNIDLSQAKGLDCCVHRGPSVVDYRTLALSRHLPVVFQKGCGLPDGLFDYIPHFKGPAIEYYSCFISYSTRDEEFASRLHADLQTQSVRCWFAPHDRHGGRKLHEQISEAIRLYDRLLLIVSNDSMSSEWVKTEIAYARKKELREKRRVLFPISIVPYQQISDWEAFDADTGKDLAREIREFFIPDFSNWKLVDNYQPALERLLLDLKQY